jgi:hypothetical protein
MIARNIGMYDMFFLIFFLIFALSFDEPLGRAVSKLGNKNEKILTVFAVLIAGLLAYLCCSCCVSREKVPF